LPDKVVAPITPAPLPGEPVAPSMILAASADFGEGAGTEAAGIPTGAAGAGVAVSEAGIALVLSIPPIGIDGKFGVPAVVELEVLPVAIELFWNFVSDNTATLDPAALSIPPISLPAAGPAYVLAPAIDTELPTIPAPGRRAAEAVAVAAGHG